MNNMSAKLTSKKLLIILSAVIALALVVGGYLIFGSSNKKTPSKTSAAKQKSTTTTPESISTTNPHQSGYALQETPPIFLTIVTHSEEVGPTPDYVAKRKAYGDSHAALIDFANMIDRNGIGWNYQSDYNFLLAVQEYDQGSAETNGKNIIKWIQDDIRNGDVDPHAHGRTYSYADIAYILKELGVSDTGIVGGFIGYPTAKSELDKLRAPVDGLHYDYTWQAKATWGSGSSNHTDDDKIQASGIWRPKSKSKFRIDDPGQLPNVGSPGNEWSDLDALLQDQQDETLTKGNIYTISITEHQGQMTSATTQAFEEEFLKYSEEIQDGRIVLVTLSEVLKIWEDDYASVPNVYIVD